MKTAIKTAVYSPVIEEVRDEREVRRAGSEGGLLSDVRGVDPALARKAAVVVSDLAADHRAVESVKSTLGALVDDDLLPSTAERRICDTYRQNLPESLPVEGAIERIYSA
ncbi:MAG: hypothetical protein MAG715_00969 [Methanonatronarchaeales archaeon]|nr:hypothetical protein [Methanonatronarchaeales archaeon]